jgi:hypothetical protein
MEKKTQNGKKKIVVQALITKIENDHQSTEIKTRIVEGYARPERITMKDSDQEGYMPDVISESNDWTNLYEIELDENNYILEKWRLFSLYSKKAKGNFSIVLPKDKLEQVKNMLQSNNIKARLIYFS